MNIEQVLLDAMAQDMAQHIDTRIIINLCIEDGWTELIVNPWKHNNRLISRWCRRYLEDAWLQEGNSWVFKNSKDATIFALRWVDGRDY